MKTIKRSKLSNMAMVAGNERRVTKVIDGGMVKQWVGIGWIDVGRIDKFTWRERDLLPVVVEG